MLVVRYALSVVSCSLLFNGCCFRCVLLIGCCLLYVAYCFLLLVGWFLFVFGCWLVVVCCFCGIVEFDCCCVFLFLFF